MRPSASLSSLRNRRRSTLWLFVLVSFLAMVVAGPNAIAKEKSRRASQTVGEYAYKRLSKANEFLAGESYAEARSELEALLARKKINSYERAMGRQTLGYVQANQDQFPDAIESFEKALGLAALPEPALGHTEKSVEILEEWFRRTSAPGARAHFTLASGYTALGRYDDALVHAQAAVNKSEAPAESYLQLLASVNYNLGRFREMAGVLEILGNRFPKKTYWMQLSAAYREIGENEKSLAVQELAYQQGFLSGERELSILAQLYLFERLPYKAARVLEKGLKSEAIGQDTDVWELLANAWLQAKEYERVVEPLEKAAARSANGDLFVRLGRVHIQNEDWSRAAVALTDGVEKGGLADLGTAHLLLGVAYANGSKPDAAFRALREASRFERSRGPAREWIAHIEQSQ